MNDRISFIVSISGHVFVILLSIIVGLIAKEKILPPAPVEVSLLAPSAESANPGTETPEVKPEPQVKPQPKVEPKKVEPKKTEPKPEIITRKTEPQKPTYDPKADLAKLEEWMKKHKLEEKTETTPVRTQTATATTSGNPGAYGSSSAYDRMIQQIVRGNWIQPSRAVLGPNPPVVEVTIRVERNGQILSSRITKPSGIARLDSSALEAVQNSNPLPEFPSYMVGSPKDFQLRFVVNE